MEPKVKLDPRLALLKELARQEYQIPVEDVRRMIMATSNYFRDHLAANGFPALGVGRILTKFRDAGRRSAPWSAFSGRVPGRPQDGADGNRRLRWLFETEHKFYATEVMATLVEVKYFLQALSMEEAPPLPGGSIQNSFKWLTGHRIVPGAYEDPIQLIPINLREFVATPRLVQSGHLIPLDRNGRHIPNNTFLMLARSNQLQGNQTVEELLHLMNQILKRHETSEPDYLQSKLD